jgi:hypothetical protein
MNKQTALDWYWDKIKSHFEHDGDLFETALITFSIAKKKEKEQQIPQQEISDEEIEKAANGHFEGDLMWSERIAFKLAIKWYREQLKNK